MLIKISIGLPDMYQRKWNAFFVPTWWNIRKIKMTTSIGVTIFGLVIRLISMWQKISDQHSKMKFRKMLSETGHNRYLENTLKRHTANVLTNMETESISSSCSKERWWSSHGWLIVVIIQWQNEGFCGIFCSKMIWQTDFLILYCDKESSLLRS